MALALVCGSAACDEAKASSDVDLLVVSDELMPVDLYQVLARQFGGGIVRAAWTGWR